MKLALNPVLSHEYLNISYVPIVPQADAFILCIISPPPIPSSARRAMAKHLVCTTLLEGMVDSLLSTCQVIAQRINDSLLNCHLAIDLQSIPQALNTRGNW